MAMLYQERADRIAEVVVTGDKLTLAQFVAVARYHAKVCLSETYKTKVQAGQDKLQAILDSGKGVYGVNTGFGDNVRFRIENKDLLQLQENIVRTHGCTSGAPFPEERIRGGLMALIAKAGLGCSGISCGVVELAAEFLNRGLTPYVPSEGVMTPLTYSAFIAQTLMGEGRFLVDGKAIPAEEIFRQSGLKPVCYRPKEGLAAIGDTALVVVPALLAIYELVDTMRHALICATLVTEALRSTDKAFDGRLLALKHHPEIGEIAAWMRKSLAGSEIMEQARECKVQDATSIRVIPHLFGAVFRQTAQTYDVLMEDFYSVTDNPAFFDGGLALMGANWDETHIALYCDALSIGAATLAKELETFMERLVDSHFSGLPHFLVKDPGLNNGFMIVQYATAGLNGDLDRLANPQSTAHGQVSAGQEAPIPRGDSASGKLYEVSHKLRTMVYMTLLTALQATDFVPEGMSPVNSRARELVRQKISFMEQDDMLYERIEAMRAVLDSGVLVDLYLDELGEFPL